MGERDDAKEALGRRHAGFRAGVDGNDDLGQIGEREAASLTTAMTTAPRARASSAAASRSGLRPDCEMAISGTSRKWAEVAR
jgi:hypothetical protein